MPPTTDDADARSSDQEKRTASESGVLVVSKHFHGSRFGISKENRIYVLHDVRTHIEEVSFVLDWNKCALCAVVFGHLKRLCERPQGLNISLDAHVAQHKESSTNGRLSKSRVAGHKK